MKFWAKVRFKGEENASELILAFFKEFNPESSISIKGKEANLEIFFDNNPPMAIIEATGHCIVDEFNFGKTLKKFREDETKHVEVEEKETSEETALVVEEKNPQNTKQANKKRGRPATKKEKPTKVACTKTVDIPQLEEIAKKATSFEHFMKLVAEMLEMNKRQGFFENLVTIAGEVEKISWKELEAALKDKGITWAQWDKTYTSKQVSGKLDVTIIHFLKAMRQYKDYSFGQEKPEEKVVTEQATEEPPEKVEDSKPKNRVKMECMPEIPHFEEVLGSVDKTLPIEERVKHVLTSMELKNMNAQEQQEIFEIANAAVRVSQMSLDIIFSKVKIPIESTAKARLTFSKFINDFASEYDPNKKVKLIDFLKELQIVIMNENEIEHYTHYEN